VIEGAIVSDAFETSVRPPECLLERVLASAETDSSAGISGEGLLARSDAWASKGALTAAVLNPPIRLLAWVKKSCKLLCWSIFPLDWAGEGDEGDEDDDEFRFAFA